MKPIFIIGFILTLISCNSSSSSSFQFYHWKAKAKYSESLDSVLTFCKTKRIYMRYFDVKPQTNSSKNNVYPEYPITQLDVSFKNYDIVPVVYITNESLKAETPVTELKNKILTLINQINTHYDIQPSEIQLDCDWTKQTKNAFFWLVDAIKKHYQVSVTIRLHQLKYPDETGIPPADRGVLMLYNMGELAKIDENYILESHIVDQYVSKNTNYSIPLDLALPLYNQAVLIFPNDKIKLINQPKMEIFSDTTSLSKLNDLAYKVKEEITFHDFNLPLGTIIKFEKSEIFEITKSMNILENSKLNFKNIIFYHLDEDVLGFYRIKKAYQRTMRILCMILLFGSINTYACGYYMPIVDTQIYFNILDQAIISDNSFDPFLRSETNPYYDNQDPNSSLYYEPIHKGNFKLWKELLVGFNDEEISSVLYQVNSFDSIWDKVNITNEEEIKDYMTFANDCSDALAYRSAYTWNYNELLNANTHDNEELYELAKLKFETSTNTQLKLRYAYQFIRIAHYSKKYEQAISFFDNNVKGQFSKNEIYYYIIDQIGGCYFSIGQTKRAGFHFLQVIAYSRDRKISATNSYRWCKPFELNPKEHPELFLTQQVLKYDVDHPKIEDFLFDYATSNPENSILEVLIVREINHLERIKLPHPDMESRIFFQNIDSTKFNNSLKNLKKITCEILNQKTLSNRDFWSLTSSYLSFLENDYHVAHKKLTKVKSSKYKEIKEHLRLAYEVYSWDKMTSKRENQVASQLEGLIGENGFSDYYSWFSEERADSWKFAILNKIGRLYFNEKEYGKSYLCFNSSYRLHSLSSTGLIKDLRRFFNQEKKNDLEKVLLNNLKTYNGFSSVPEYLDYCEGLIYLQRNKPDKAKQFFKEDQKTFNAKNLIFSNHTRSSSMHSIFMTDSIVHSDWFSFIPEKMNFHQLSSVLAELKTYSIDSTNKKQILSNYLLGNFFYNTSNTGFYKKTLRNYASSYRSFFNSKKSGYVDFDEKIEKAEIDGFYDVHQHFVTDLDLAQISYDYYKRVIQLSENSELKARTSYMMAKCELNRFLNEAETTYYYNPTSWRGSKINDKYLSGFALLQTDYSQTEFYKEIIEECSFFRYYTQNNTKQNSDDLLKIVRQKWENQKKIYKD